MLMLALAVIPFQGFAQTIVAINCDPGMHHSHGADEHPQVHHHQDGTQRDHSHVKVGSDDSASGHADELCCKMTVSVLPLPFVVLAEPGPDVAPVTTGPSRYSIYIKLLQRPPLV